MSDARAIPATAPVFATSYDGQSATEIAATLMLPRVMLFDTVSSTLDIAHTLGEEGADAGTLVLADEQTAGRGRMGRTWHSEPGRGIWLTLLERPVADESLSVLSVRIALALAPVLEPFVQAPPVRLKWPNDVHVDDRKLAGVLVEARWRGTRLDWIAVGVGINVRAPLGYEAACLAPGTDRLSVLRAVIPSLRRAVARTGPLTRDELAAYRARDLAVGRDCEMPARGRVAGIDASGALLIDTEHGRTAFHGGSLILTDASATR